MNEFISKRNQKEIKTLVKNFKKEHRRIEVKFFDKMSGITSCRENSLLVDNLIKDLYRILEQGFNNLSKNFLVSAVGGYGRKQLAPFSDLDIVFIHKNSYETKKLEKFIQFLLYPLWDLGFKIGHATRTFKQVVESSRKDHIIRTSMLDARLICGSKSSFLQLMEEYKKDISKKGGDFFKEKIDERTKKLNNINFNFFRNEPDIKESGGSIRDINLIFWGLKILNIIKDVPLKDFLSKNEEKKLNESLDFLLTIRCFLHYLSKRSNNKLSFEYQKIIAEKILPKKNSRINSKVEILMKNYFFHTSSTKSFTQIIVKILSKKINSKLRVKSKIEKFRADNNYFVEELIGNIIKGKENFFEQRQLLDNIDKIPKKNFTTKKTIRFFKKTLFDSKNKDKLILLNDLGIISQIIPEFSDIIHKTQFDRFHSMTVDQHTLRAINILKDINESPSNSSYKLAKRIYDKNPNRHAIFYALLLHDIGKGKRGDHNIIGSSLSKKILTSLGEKSDMITKVSWLIKNHLLLSEYAFKKDLQDYSIIKKLSREIKNRKNLDLLYLLTVADISAVDQGLWNSWKALLLEETYFKCLNEIIGPNKKESLNERISIVKDEVLSISKKLKPNALDEFSKITYPNFWLLQSPKDIAFQIENFFNVSKKNKDFDFYIKTLDEKNIFHLTIVTNDRPKLFLDIISIFVLEDISVLEARIFTLDDESVIDTFKISLPRYESLHEKEINEKINNFKKKLKLIKNGVTIKTFKKNKSETFPHHKTEIYIDNKTSSTYSVLVVIANNRPRFLYDISKILIKNELIISMAKISTYGDFVEDSFHLRNKFGFKIKDGEMTDNLIKEIKNSLNKISENVF